jgi:hypothetical protein
VKRWRRSIRKRNRQRLVTHRRRLAGPARRARVSKNYAVGLEMSCPGGAYHWAPRRRDSVSHRTIASVRAFTAKPSSDYIPLGGFVHFRGTTGEAIDY